MLTSYLWRVDFRYPDDQGHIGQKYDRFINKLVCSSHTHTRLSIVFRTRSYLIARFMSKISPHVNGRLNRSSLYINILLCATVYNCHTELSQ